MINKILIPLLALLFISGCKKDTPKILIIGDSISIGYTPFVKEMLEGRALVYHNQGNAEHTGTGLARIEEWIGEEEWDIIQFNWGLWDLAYRHEDAKTQGKRDKINGKVTFTPDEYQANLDSIVKIMKGLTNAKLLFVTTSYVPEGEVGRFVEDAIVYNERAKKTMKKNKVPVNDIYDYSRQIHSEFATESDDVHFTEEGYRKLASEIVTGLEKLERRIK